ncbi:MAG: lipid-A-disaccharide synthase [Saprospiraceae bacterium]
MKYFLIAGEASGDLHGAWLMKALKKQDADAQFAYWGGELMADEGGVLLKHYRELAFMGFVEVVKNLRTISRNFRLCKQQIVDFQPDALVLVDYPGFNLRMAKWAKQRGMKVFYYISPQVWAWHTSRVHKIKKYVDHLLAILPFEQDFYAQYGYEVHFVGHPLIDVMNDFQPALGWKEALGIGKPLVALLPGSRKQEIDTMLQVMLAVAARFPDFDFVVAGAPSQTNGYYEGLLAKYQAPTNVRLLSGQTYALLHEAQAALVTSGTATLETALMGCPQIVCYKGNAVSYQIARRLIQVKYISLVNLIMDAPLVLELIQNDYTVDKVSQALTHLMQPAEQERLRQGYAALRTRLGDGGAPDRSAAIIVANT